MKILAIRGKNLNSLADEFEVRLDQPPLLGAGLFAIVGPTGAGKSTLLDAMCLALFGQVPRLLAVERNAAPVGRADQEPKERIAAHDPRSMLRRGAVRGLAQVDFLGRDRKAYRATWSVHRALNKHDGKVVEPTFSLDELESGARLSGSGKRETLKQIEAQLGLSFDQFRRSAMLAQGDFAAFLKAKAEERADLLERITGTELYSQLSKGAHERRRAEAQTLEVLEAQLGGVVRLTAEERGALESERGQARTTLEALDAERQQLTEAVGWHLRSAELATAIAQAEAALAGAEQADGSVAGLREELERARQAEGLRGRWEALERAREAEAAAVGEVAEAEARSVTAAQALEEASAQLLESQARSADAVAQEAERQPELARAEALDGELATLEQQAATARSELERSQTALAQAAAALAQATQKIEQARATELAAHLWLEAHAADRPLAERWPVWEAELERAGAAVLKRGKAERALPEATAALSRLTGARAAAEAAATGAERELAGARATAEAQARALEAAPTDGLRKARQAAEAELLRSERAQARLRQVLALDAELRTLAGEREEALRAAQALGAEAEQARESVARTEVRLEEARRSEDEIRKRLGHQAARAELVDGEPCPLCGAPEHPYVGQDDVVAELLSGATRRVKELVREQTAAVKQRERHLAGAEARLQTAQALEARAGALGATRARTLAEAAQEGLTVCDAAAAEALERAIEAQRRVVDDALAAEARGAQLADAAVQSAGLRDRAAEAHRLAVEQARKAEDLEREAGRARERIEAEVRTEAGRLDEALTALAPIVASEEGRAALIEDPAGFLAARRRQAQAWSAQQGQHARALEQQQLAAVELEGASRSEASAREAAGRWSVAVGEADLRIASVRALRAALLGGRPVSEERSRLRAGVEAARTLLARGEKAHAEATLTVAQAAQARERTALARTARISERERCAGALAEGLAQAQLEEAAVRTLLARGAAWFEQTQAGVEAVDRELERARTVLAERRTQQESLAARGAPALAQAPAQAQLEALTERTRVLLQQVGGLTERLTQDDAAAQKQRSGEAELAAQRQRFEVWGALGELIGSHDGKTFRLFAQSLTLEALLVPANRQLAELAPRYRLMRVPGHDLDLQVVDRDLADEVRSVASLSGGESFLVSLALALGLSSLSASQTPVETLFIDEGFGTLDPETLEMVLSILDSLQATGRQVGVISHVPGLGERIGAQVHVDKLGQGRSRVRVLGSEAALAARGDDTRTG